MFDVARAIDGILALTLAAGLAAVIVAFAIARLGSFKSDAAARFTLSFAVLIVVAVVTPGLAGTTMLASRSQPVVVASAPATTINFANFVKQQNVQRSSRSSRDVTNVYVPPQPAAAQFPLATLLALVWLCGCGLGMLRVCLGVIRLRQLVREGRPIGVRSTERGCIRIFAHGALPVPVAIGYRRPAVLIPEALVATASEGDFEHIVLHELEHLRRYDDVSSLLQSLCMAILWFNPFAYVVQRSLAIDREMACDEAVVRRLGVRHGYASTLWNISLAVSDASAPRVAAAFAEGAHTVRRVTNLLDSSHARVSRFAFVAVVITVLTLLAGASIGGASAVSASRLHSSDAASITLADGTRLLVGGRNVDSIAVGYATIVTSDGRLLAQVPFAVPRWSTTLTRLLSGDVLVTGGTTPNGTTADVELYHWRSKSFEPVGRLHIARVAHTGTLLPDGTVLIAAGERAPGKLESSTELYDPVTRRFTLTADGYGRISQTAIRIDNGDVLMLGGDPGRGRKRCAIIYSVARHSYREAGTLVRATPTHLTFELPGGALVTHTID